MLTVVPIGPYSDTVYFVNSHDNLVLTYRTCELRSVAWWMVPSPLLLSEK